MTDGPSEHRAQLMVSTCVCPKIRVAKTKRATNCSRAPWPPPYHRLLVLASRAYMRGPAKMQPLSGREERIPSVPKSIQKFKSGEQQSKTHYSSHVDSHLRMLTGQLVPRVGSRVQNGQATVPPGGLNEHRHLHSSVCLQTPKCFLKCCLIRSRMHCSDE